MGVVDSSASTRDWLHGAGKRGLDELVVVDADSGVHWCHVRPRGGEVLSMFNLSVHARLTIDTLRTMIYG